MTHREIITRLYKLLLIRNPAKQEMEWWLARFSEGEGAVVKLLAFIENSKEFQTKRRVATQFPPGHFHSPIVDTSNVAKYFEREVKRLPNELAGIDLDARKMRQLWLSSLDFVRSTPFQDNKNSQDRYYYTGGPFPWGDAIALRMMIGHFRPRKIVEIGSGFSTACMLDSIDHAALPNVQLTCIDPNTERLRALLRDSDKGRVTIVEDAIQNIDPDIVDRLEQNDILFIDSTHVVKTGSDVHYEFFYLLPRLKPGVLIHVHDIMYPFEYPKRWVVDDNYSWNEAYFLRAFLMYNPKYEIIFWTPFFAREYSREISAEFPTFLKNPGGSIWLRRTA